MARREILEGSRKMARSHLGSLVVFGTVWEREREVKRVCERFCQGKRTIMEKMVIEAMMAVR